MEIQCPNCQRKITILEQHAGMMMNCPLCAGTFTAPVLPPPPAPFPARPPAPASVPARPAPPAPAEAGSPAAAAGAPPPIELTLLEHTGRFSVWISPRYTQYVPAAALFLVLLLAFFPWVAICPGDVCLDSQSGCQAVFGWSSVSERDLQYQSWVKGKQRVEAIAHPMAGEAANPRMGLVTLLYLLMVAFNLVVTAAAAGVPFAEKFLPPIVKQYLVWRWPFAAAVTLLAVAVLLLQDARGLSLERRANDAVSKVTKKIEEDLTKKQKEGLLKDMEAAEIPKEVMMERGIYEQAIVRTFWYRCVFWLQCWALVFVFVTMLAELRLPRPCPRIDVLW